MYKEKIQEFINLCDKDVLSTTHVYIIETMGVEYDGCGEGWCHIIMFNEPNTDKLFQYLETLNNGLVIFDRMDFWYYDGKNSVNLYDYLKDFSNRLRNLSVENNLIIFT
jgi:hypothetical protein